MNQCIGCIWRGTCLGYQQTQPGEMTFPYDIPCTHGRLLVLIFSINNNKLLCIVDYYSKIPTLKKADDSLADDLIRAVKIAFTEFGLTNEIASDSGRNLISDWFKTILQTA